MDKHDYVCNSRDSHTFRYLKMEAYKFLQLIVVWQLNLFILVTIYKIDFLASNGSSLFAIFIFNQDRCPRIFLEAFPPLVISLGQLWPSTHFSSRFLEFLLQAIFIKHKQ